MIFRQLFRLDTENDIGVSIRQLREKYSLDVPATSAGNLAKRANEPFELNSMVDSHLLARGEDGLDGTHRCFGQTGAVGGSCGEADAGLYEIYNNLVKESTDRKLEAAISYVDA